MSNRIFTPDVPATKEYFLYEKKSIEQNAAVITTNISEDATRKGAAFADEIRDQFIANFEKEGTDRMAHVSTFLYVDGYIYMTYYANTQGAAEDPNFQTARLAYCPVDNTKLMTILDIQSVGDTCGGGDVIMVYDTILMQKDPETLYVLWTANVSGNYYRLCRTFRTTTKELGPVQVNRFQVGEIVNDFSTTGIQSALASNGIGGKVMYSDIGIMQKTSTRMENGELYYYTGAYSGDFTCIIKSKDFVTWEYVSQPDFVNESQWENATYVIGDRCYYFVRQYVDSPYGFLTVYDLVKGTWETPVLVEDCQSRGDFIVYQDDLYLFHAPTDREHIGILKIDQENIAHSTVVLQAHMHESCFYPFVQYGDDGELRMSYTMDRKHIRLAKFELKKYL